MVRSCSSWSTISWRRVHAVDRDRPRPLVATSVLRVRRLRRPHRAGPATSAARERRRRVIRPLGALRRLRSPDRQIQHARAVDRDLQLDRFRRRPGMRPVGRRQRQPDAMAGIEAVPADPGFDLDVIPSPGFQGLGGFVAVAVGQVEHAPAHQQRRPVRRDVLQPDGDERARPVYAQPQSRHTGNRGPRPASSSGAVVKQRERASSGDWSPAISSGLPLAHHTPAVSPHSCRPRIATSENRTAACQGPGPPAGTSQAAAAAPETTRRARGGTRSGGSRSPAGVDPRRPPTRRTSSPTVAGGQDASPIQRPGRTA